MSEALGYEKHICTFCGGPDAGYQRRRDGGTKEYFDACEDCARKPYKHDAEQPEQLKKGE